MNNDLISRSDIKDHIGELLLVYSGADLANAILNAIDNAPTVDAYTFNQVKELFDLNVQMADEIENLKRPQGEWIPVSERLPAYSGLYLISVDDVVTVANFTGTYFMHRGGGRVEVYAWQPLPEPYEKGGTE